MGRPSNRGQRRAEIVAGLRQVMASQGYEAAAVAEIARAAGLAPGLVHYHFGSKLEILLALVEELAAAMQERVAALRAEGGEARALLEGVLELHLGLGAADPEALACWVAIGAEALRLPEVREAYAAALAGRHALLSELCRAALAAEGRSTRRAKAAAAALSAAIEGYFQLAAAAPELIPRGSAAPSAKRMLAGLLGE